MNAQEAERYVRERWQEVRYEEVARRFTDSLGRVLVKRPNGGGWILSGNVHSVLKDEAWLAAYEFTKQREEEIRLKKEEIEEIKKDIAAYEHHGRGHEEPEAKIYRRILGVLESQLQNLQRGFREQETNHE